MDVNTSFKANAAAGAALKKAPVEKKAEEQEQAQDGDSFEPSRSLDYSPEQNLWFGGGAILATALISSGHPVAKAVGFGIGGLTAVNGAVQAAKGSDWQTRVNGGLQVATGVATIASGSIGTLASVGVSIGALTTGQLLNRPGQTAKGIASAYGESLATIGGVAWDGTKAGVKSAFKGSKEA